MPLWCDKPPPLLTGNKICSGDSRIRSYCWDSYGTGMCASHTLEDCSNACRQTPGCQIFVHFPAEMEGSCMLCKDMFTMEPTTDATSRVYASTPAPAPPASLTSKFSVIAEAPPSPPPTSALHRPTQQIGSGSHLGRAPSSGGGRVGAHCEFEEGIEYVLDVTAGYDDRTAPSMEGCCDLCSAQPTCTRFVFEKSTGTCVLLPNVADDQPMVRLPEAGITSGTVSSRGVTVLRAGSTRCNFQTKMGMAGGALPIAAQVAFDALGSPGSAQECCDRCKATTHCAKFTYDEVAHRCTFYPGQTEYVTLPLGGLIAGDIIQPGVSAFSSSMGLAGVVAAGFTPSLAPAAAGYGGGYGSLPRATGAGQADGGSAPRLSFPPTGPQHPTFHRLHIGPPPPPPNTKAESARAQSWMMTLSVVMIGLIIGVIGCFAYLFFSREILGLLHTLSLGRLGASISSGPPGGGSRAVGMGGAERPPKKGTLRVEIQGEKRKPIARTLRATRWTSSDDLKLAIFDKAGGTYRRAEPEDYTLLCDVPEGAWGGECGWLEVTDETDLAAMAEHAGRLRLCPARLLDDDTGVAFHMDERPSRALKGGGGSRTAGGGERSRRKPSRSRTIEPAPPPPRRAPTMRSSRPPSRPKPLLLMPPKELRGSGPASPHADLERGDRTPIRGSSRPSRTCGCESSRGPTVPQRSRSGSKSYSEYVDEEPRRSALARGGSKSGGRGDRRNGGDLRGQMRGASSGEVGSSDLSEDGFEAEPLVDSPPTTRSARRGTSRTESRKDFRPPSRHDSSRSDIRTTWRRDHRVFDSRPPSRSASYSSTSGSLRRGNGAKQAADSCAYSGSGASAWDDDEPNDLSSPPSRSGGSGSRVIEMRGRRVGGGGVSSRSYSHR